MEICRFYAKGNCAFGTACRYEHVRPGERGRQAPQSASQQEQQIELEEERIDPYDDQPCTFRQLREKYFGLYSEVEMRKYWQSEMQPTGNSRPALRAVSAADGKGSRSVCKFFLQGSCNFGDSCRNLHVVDVAQLDGDPVVPSGRGLASAAPFTEESQRATEEAVGDVPPFPPPPEPEQPRSGEDRWSRRTRVTEDRWSRRARAGDDAECGICFESIRGKGERFGMLESCACAFCLSCIRAWRKQKEQQDRVNLRMCPLCRNESFFVVPCDSLVLDPEEKSKAIDDYKRQMSLVPCQAFDYGRGKCPFGSSCFYAHLNPDGTRYNPAPVRKMVGMSGTQVIGEVKLSDFL